MPEATPSPDQVSSNAREPGHRAPLLGTSNPARLSRTEFRICVLLSQGLNPTSVSGELGMSPATLRAHVRRILLKTGVGSFKELLAELIGQGSLVLEPTASRSSGSAGA